MRPNRGRFLGLVLLFASALLFGSEPYSWSLKTTKSSVYVNEAVEIEYTCQFQDEAYLHVIEFTPEGENEAYRLLPLGVIEKTTDGRRSDTYRYVLFPKTAGQKEFDFTALMRKTTKESIENSVIGRDNVEDYSFQDTEVQLPPVYLDVRGHQETMTGYFTLNVSLDKNEVKAYMPVHLSVVVKGEGDFDQMQDFRLNMDGVKVFSEPGEKHYKLTKNGFKGEWEQKFSLVGAESFRVEPIELSYFDIAKKERVVLRSKAFDVNVKAAYTKEELLDDVEDEGGSWWQWWYLNYLFTFILGVVLGRNLYRFRWREKKTEDSASEIMACRSVNCVLTKLVIGGEARYEPLIQKYEALGKKASVKELKKEIASMMNSDTITEEKGRNV
ncbi:MAG: hypothetical protein ABFR02_02360 [Campylobacterota bacterium]